MMRIVSRVEWGAPPTPAPTIAVPTAELWQHHSASQAHGPAAVRAIRDYHIGTRGYLDIAYSFLVDQDGTIYEGRGAGRQGGHTEGHNSISHAICALGNYEIDQPSRALIHSTAWLVRHGREEGWWHDLTGGHRDASGAQTACPGRNLYAALDDIRRLAAGEESDVTPEELRVELDASNVRLVAAIDTTTKQIIIEALHERKLFVRLKRFLNREARRERRRQARRATG